jgi:hypothetical protein
VADAKTRVIPFGEFLPDEGELYNEGLVSANQVWPYGGKYVPSWPVNDFSASIGASGGELIYGGIAAAVGNFQYEVFVGDTNDLFDIYSAGQTTPWTVDEISSSTGAYTTDTAVGWHFAQFGNYILACNGWTDEVQYTTYAAAGATGNFASATTGGDYPYRAKCIGVLGQFVVLGNVKYTAGAGNDEYPHRVAWSGRDDILDWSDPTTQVAADVAPTGTDYQDLYDDFGEVSGIAGSHDYALIFKHRGIYRMQMGGPFGASFRLVSSNIGCSWPHSIKVVGTDVYWWGVNGPCVYKGLSGEIIELGLGRITRSLIDTVAWVNTGLAETSDTFSNTAPWQLSVGYDACVGCVVWGLPISTDTHAGHAIYATSFLAYNINEDKFSLMKVNGTSNPADSANLHCTYLFDNPPTDDTFVPGRDLIFAGYSNLDQLGTANKLFGFSAEHGIVATAGSAPFLLSNQTKLRTGYLDLVQSSSGKPTDHRIKKIRVVYNKADAATLAQIPQWNITVNGRDYWGDTASSYTANSGSDLDTDDHAGYGGWISLPSTGYHQMWQFQFELERTMATNTEVYVAEIEGFEVMYSVR